MRSWKRFSHKTSSRILATVLTLEAALLLSVVRAAAQQTLEQRYQQGLDYFRDAKMEEACEILQQIEKESPGYKEIYTYLNPSCMATKQLYSLEERLFKEGVELFKKGSYDDAKQRFEQAIRIPLKNPKYRAQIAPYTSEIETKLREESLFQEAVDLFNKGKDSEATAAFNRVIQSGSAKSAEAGTYLQRIEERREGRAFEAAVAAFNGGRYDEARRGFEQIAGAGGAKAAQAHEYLPRIDTALKQQASVREAVVKAQSGSKDPLQVARQFLADAQAAVDHKDYGLAVEKLRVAQALDPANRDVRQLLSQVEDQAAEQTLRRGLAAYFEGRYDEAERSLTDYLINHGKRQALAYFFSGAVHSSLYLLSDEQDVAEKQKAAADFRAAQMQGHKFRPSDEFVSPKILRLYSESIKGGSPEAGRQNP